MQTAVHFFPVASLAICYFLTLWWLNQRAEGRNQGIGTLVIFAVLAAVSIYFGVNSVPPIAKGWLNSNPLESAISGIVVAGLSDHPLDDTDLAGQTLLALGDMLIRLSKVFALLLHVWHGLLIMRLIARASHVIRRRRLWNRMSGEMEGAHADYPWRVAWSG